MWSEWRARLAGWRCARRKARAAARPAPELASGLPAGVSVIIPSRNGKHLLENLLPALVRELRGLTAEIIISDNGSDDGTSAFLASHWPQAKLCSSGVPLSFARAVNAGIREAHFSHIFLLNNDMELEEAFFPPLLEAFEREPELFCATAQIFFPSGRRREETGKTVWRPAARRNDPDDFPVWCEEPLSGEDGTWALYGSGGCSLYDAAKLRALGGMDESYEPAYVEDLDLGYHAWQHGWPTVYIAGARLVHQHRATSRRYYSETELQTALEVNYLRFLAKRIASPSVFRAMWGEAITRLTRLTLRVGPEGDAARRALRQAVRAIEWMEPPLLGPLDDATILSLCGGATARFPGSGTGAGVISVPDLRAPTADELRNHSDLWMVRADAPDARAAIERLL
jgi:GT2 family glycosyltransferase